MTTLDQHMKLIGKIFEADRAVRTAESELLGTSDEAALGEVLTRAVVEAKALDDDLESAMRLTRLSDLCAQVPGPLMADALLQILNDDDPVVRVAAGEAILDVGYERYAEVARAIERVLDAGLSGPAMTELPFILAEIGEPSALPLIRRFLSHADGDVVAAAIESLVELGDPEAIPALTHLKNDSRQVTLEDAEAEGAELVATIGELAREASEALAPQRPSRAPRRNPRR